MTCFPDFTSQEHFINYSVDFIEVEHKIQLTDIVKILVENLDKVVNSFEVVEVIIIDINADAEVETGVSSVDNFKVSELHEVCVFGIPHRHN